MVVHGFKEGQLKEMNKYFHVLPNLMGVVLALTAIPVYGWFEYGCHITPADSDGGDGKLWATIVFVVLPIGTSILGVTGCLLMVYLKVREQAKAASRWTMGVGQAGQLEQAVFWQCVCYGMAFYIR